MQQSTENRPPDIKKAVPEEARVLLERIKSYLTASVENPRTARDVEDPAELMEALRELRRARSS